MKKYLTYVIGIAALIVLIIVLSGRSDQPKTSLAASAGMLVSQEQFFDFGMIKMKDGLVRKDFILAINKVYTSCMCTTAIITAKDGKKSGPFGMPGHGGLSNDQVTVQPGDQVTLQAIFDPAAHGPAGVGRADRTVYLETNSTTAPKVELNFTATVVN
jgi:hypothetical protein